MPQTSDPGSDPFFALDQLSSALNHLLDVTQTGKWEQIEALVPIVSRAADAALKSPLPPKNTATYRARLTELLAMHKQAIEQCTARMSDIAPMISAFSGSRNTAAKP